MICDSPIQRFSIRLLLTAVVVVLFAVTNSSFAQAPGDSVVIHQQLPDERDVGLDDDFSPGLFFLALTGLILILVSSIFMCALVLGGVLFLFALITGGVVSASLLYGLHRKSLEEGFRAFCIMFFTLSGFFGVSIVFYLFNKLTHWWDFSSTLIIGSVSGLTAGYLTGKLMFFAITTLIGRFKIWYEKRNTDYFSNS